MTTQSLRWVTKAVQYVVNPLLLSNALSSAYCKNKCVNQNTHTIYNTSKVSEMNPYLHFWARLSDNNPCFKKEKKTRIWSINLRQSQTDCRVTKPTKKESDYQQIVYPEPFPSCTPSMAQLSRRVTSHSKSVCKLRQRLGLSVCKSSQYLFCTVLKGLLVAAVVKIYSILNHLGQNYLGCNSTEVNENQRKS